MTHLMVIHCRVHGVSVSFAISGVYDRTSKRLCAIRAQQILDKKRRSSRWRRRVTLCDFVRHLPFSVRKTQLSWALRVRLTHAIKKEAVFFAIFTLDHVLSRSWQKSCLLNRIVPFLDDHTGKWDAISKMAITVGKIPPLRLTAPGGRRIPVSECFIWVN